MPVITLLAENLGATTPYKNSLENLAQAQGMTDLEIKIICLPEEIKNAKNTPVENWDSTVAPIMLASLKNIQGKVVICSNDLSIVTPALKTQTNCELIDLNEAINDHLSALSSTPNIVSILATKRLMQHYFFKDNLIKNGQELVLPSHESQELLNFLIYDKLAPKTATEEDMDKLLNILNEVKNKGTQMVICACRLITVYLAENNIIQAHKNLKNVLLPNGKTIPWEDTTDLVAHKALA